MPTPPTYSGAQQAKRDLGARLGEIRRASGLTGRALAALCSWHEAKVSRIENGKTSPSADDIRAWAENCGAAGQTADLIASVEAIEGMFIEWRRMEKTGLKRSQEAVLPLWERTRRYRAYAPWIVPGIVQTASYTRALLRSLMERRNLPDDVDVAVKVRTERVRLLYEGDRRFAVLIEESVLRNVIGDADVMAGQLGHLLTIGELPSASLGIVPMGIVRNAIWPVEDFWIFDDKQVNVELISGYLTITQPSEVAMYADAFARLADLAVVGVAARKLITAAIDALE